MGKMDFKNRGGLVYETLKQEILDLRLKPGQMISESGICERFGVSRTPVRDAFRLLQKRGLVKTVSYRDTYMTLLSLGNTEQMIYMRVAVKTMILRDFLEIQTPVVIGDIHHSIIQRRAVIRGPGLEPKQSYRADARMHSIWSATVRRQRLWEVLRVRQLHYTRSRILDFIAETDLMRIIGEYEDLFSMIVDKNEKGLEKALKEHLHYSTKYMRRSIEVDYGDYFEEEDGEGRLVI